MLPNWLYGKSKSKLASILGGGGGTPADYDQVKAQVTQNAEDILLLSDALDGKAALTQISNHNILHNPWFNVNQREITSLTSGGKIADRWAITGSGSWSVTRTSEGYLDIDNSNNENTLYLLQKRTPTYLNSLQGYPLTASVMFSDGRVVFGTKLTSTGTIYVDSDDIAITRNFQSEILNVNIKPGKHVIIKALKLEVGEISTLHLDPRPEMALELAKCQRYFIRMKNNSNSVNIPLTLGVGVNNIIIFNLPLPSQMRTAPTLTASSVKIERPGSTSPSGTPTLTMRSITGNIVRIDVSGITPTAGAIYSLDLNSGGGYIDFDAEL